MDDIQEIVKRLAENICNDFCKFSKTGNDGHCIWCQMHNDECPLDEIMEKAGLK